MNIIRVKHALAIATVGLLAAGIAAAASAQTRGRHDTRKPRATPVVATDQGGSHTTWRYFGGPRGGVWPAASN